MTIVESYKAYHYITIEPLLRIQILAGAQYVTLEQICNYRHIPDVPDSSKSFAVFIASGPAKDFNVNSYNQRICETSLPSISRALHPSAFVKDHRRSYRRDLKTLVLIMPLRHLPSPALVEYGYAW